MAFMDYMPQFGNNTATMQETALPADDTAMQLELKRRLKMAEALQQQAGPEGQMVSGHYVAPSWTQYLANAYGKYQGGKQEREALGQFGEYQKAKQAKLANLLTDLGQGKEVTEPMDYNEAGNMPGMEQTIRKPFSQQEFMTKVGGVMPDLVPKMLEAQIAQYTKENVPVNVAKGGSLVDPKTGKVIYQAPSSDISDFAKVDIDKFDPQSVAKFAQTKNYADLLPIGKPDVLKAPPFRTIMQGGNEIQQELQKDGTWKEVGRGARFAPREDGQKPPSGYRFGPNGTLEAIKGGPADINNKPMKEIPPTARQAYSGNVASIAQIDAAIAAAKKAPDDYFGLKGGLGNTYMSRMYPDSTDVRQKITGVSAAKRHELSGSAVTPSENAATAALLPQSTDDKATIVKKLEGLRDIYSSTNQAISGSFGDEYKPLAQKTIVKTGTDKTTGRKVVQYSDGTTAYAD